MSAVVSFKMSEIRDGDHPITVAASSQIFFTIVDSKSIACLSFNCIFLSPQTSEKTPILTPKRIHSSLLLLLQQSPTRPFKTRAGTSNPVLWRIPKPCQARINKRIKISAYLLLQTKSTAAAKFRSIPLLSRDCS